MRKFWILFFLLIPFVASFAQDAHTLDSLKNILKSHPRDTTGVFTLNEMGFVYEDIDDSMSLIYYRKAAALGHELGSSLSEGYSTMNIAIAQAALGHSDSAIIYYRRAIDIYGPEAPARYRAMVYSNLGIILRQSGKLSDAIDVLITGQKIAQQGGEKDLEANCRISIGNIYRQKGNLEPARKYFTEALAVYTAIGNKLQMAICLNNVGLVYSDQKDHEAALQYYFRSLKLRQEINNERGVANSLENIALEYADLNDLKTALTYHNKSLELSQKTNYIKGIATAEINIAAVYTRQKKYAQAITLLQDALDKARGMQHLDMIKSIYEALAENYYAAGRYKEAFDAHAGFSKMKDSIVNEEENAKIAELNTQFETEKKDHEIRLLNRTQELQAADLRKKNLLIWAAIAGLALLACLLFFILRSYRIKQRANAVIVRQKEEVEKQKIIIEEKNKEILDSIHYAKRIQRGLFASESILTKSFSEHFVFYKPKDIVSGDFYWAMPADGKIFLCTADCTGHGVPGAFMSLLGINFLKEIISIKKILRPDLVFNELKNDIIATLNPEGMEGEAKDGMDAVLCCYDLSQMQMTYAAANNPIWLVRDGMVQEHKADKQPIGKYFDDNMSFSLNTVELKKGDVIYTFTDGYADQFGGPQGKKFKYKPLQQLLLSIANLPMKEQQQILDRELTNWKGMLEQVDDILIIGVRV